LETPNNFGIYNFSKEIKESNKFNKKEKIGIKKN